MELTFRQHSSTWFLEEPCGTHAVACLCACLCVRASVFARVSVRMRGASTTAAATAVSSAATAVNHPSRHCSNSDWPPIVVVVSPTPIRSTPICPIPLLDQRDLCQSSSPATAVLYSSSLSSSSLELVAATAVSSSPTGAVGLFMRLTLARFFAMISPNNW